MDRFRGMFEDFVIIFFIGFCVTFVDLFYKYFQASMLPEIILDMAISLALGVISRYVYIRLMRVRPRPSLLKVFIVLALMNVVGITVICLAAAGEIKFSFKPFIYCTIVVSVVFYLVSLNYKLDKALNTSLKRKQEEIIRSRIVEKA